MTFFIRFGGLAVFGVALLAGCKASQVPATAAELSAPLPAGTPYALLHLYRPGKFVGFAIGYDVRLNDSVLYRARNGSQAAVPLRRLGAVTITAKTEARAELPLTLEAGREYYVRCSIGMGAAVGHPRLAQVPVAEGRREVRGISASQP